MVGLLGGGGRGSSKPQIDRHIMLSKSIRNSPSTSWLKRSDLNQTNISLNIILLKSLKKFNYSSYVRREC